MKAIPVTRYQCDVCKAEYETQDAALLCESRPVREDRGVSIGDEVMITGGSGEGLRCKVESVSVLSREWGHYAWERYWHTVCLTGKVIGSYGHRMLTFDNYRLLSASETVDGVKP